MNKISPKNSILYEIHFLNKKLSRPIFWLFSFCIFITFYLIWFKLVLFAFDANNPLDTITKLSIIRLVISCFTTLLCIWRTNDANMPLKWALFYFASCILSMILGSLFLFEAQREHIIYDNTDFSWCNNGCPDEGMQLGIIFNWAIGTALMLFLPNPIEAILTGYLGTKPTNKADEKSE